MGFIGDTPREYEYEPLTSPSVPEPVTAPIEEPAPALKPAPAGLVMAGV